jgi:hypothetical protein
MELSPNAHGVSCPIDGSGLLPALVSLFIFLCFPDLNSRFFASAARLFQVNTLFEAFFTLFENY